MVKVSASTRRFILAIAILTAGILGYFSIRDALAEYYVRLGTLGALEEATRLEPSNARNWDALARYWQFSFEKPDLDRAVIAYRKALELAPHSASTWLGLASAYESEANLNAARAAFIEAKRSYPASADASWEYGNFLLRRDEQTEGFLEIRGAVEANPALGLEAFLLCRHFEQDVDSILDRVVPPIVSVYWDILWELTSEGRTGQGLSVWSRLVALHPKLQTREAFFFVEGLLNEGRWTEAKQVWSEALSLMDLPRLNDARGSLIWDGGFETDIVGSGFAWRIHPRPNVVISYDQKSRHSGMRSLRIDFGSREDSDFADVCQRVVVDPNSNYELSAWLRTRELVPERGLFLQIKVLGQPGNQSAKSSELSGTNEWTRVWTPWVSPNSRQLAEVCMSRLSSISSNRTATAWVDDVSLVKVD